MNSPTKEAFGSIIKLNVGGKRFSTSKETLTWIPDSFFCSLLSGRISSFQDEKGAIFVDRDPEIFRVILSFLRTKEVSLTNVDIKSLKREAEFFGVTPLVNRLTVCQELDRTSCGNVLFHGMLQRPVVPSFPTSNLEMTDSTKQVLSLQHSMNKNSTDSRQVLIITGHNSWIAVAYAHSIICYKVKESCGWQQVFVSPYLSEVVEKAAINAKVQGMAPDSKTRMVAVAFSSSIRLWSFQDENTFNEIGTFDMASQIEALFFIGSQLVSTGCKSESREGKVGVWNAVSQHWQTQDVVPITSHDTAGAFLLLGGVNGVIYYIDMQKFPLRLKDNDLLITELYRDQSNSAITALSVYLTPKNSISAGNWIEVAYGTANGAVCVIVQHPELVGQGFQLFQTFTVHRSPVCKVVLSEKHLVSVCSDNNHVRTWTVTRFRGMISTQPGSTPLASYKVLSLEPLEPSASYSIGNDIGPHGEREEVPIFIQKLFPLSNLLYIRLSSTGRRLAVVKSVDESPISCFCLRECEGSSRMGSRPRKYLFTGHSNGAIQIWDMTTAFDLTPTKGEKDAMGGPTQQEMLQLLGLCDFSVSPTDSPINSICVPSTDLLDRMLRGSNTSLSSTGTVVDRAFQQPGAQNIMENLVAASNSSCDISTVDRHSSEESRATSSHRRHSSLSSNPPGGIPLPGLTPEPRVIPQDPPLVRSDSTRSFRSDKSKSSRRRNPPDRIKCSSGENSGSSASSSPLSPEENPLVFTTKKQTSSRIVDESLNFIWRVPASTEVAEAGIKMRNLSLDDSKPSTSLGARTGQARNSYKTAIMDSSGSPVPTRKGTDSARQRPASAIILGSSRRSHRRQTSDVDLK